MAADLGFFHLQLFVRERERENVCVCVCVLREIVNVSSNIGSYNCNNTVSLMGVVFALQVILGVEDDQNWHGLITSALSEVIISDLEKLRNVIHLGTPNY